MVLVNAKVTSLLLETYVVMSILNKSQMRAVRSTSHSQNVHLHGRSAMKVLVQTIVNTFQNNKKDVLEDTHVIEGDESGCKCTCPEGDYEIPESNLSYPGQYYCDNLPPENN